MLERDPFEVLGIPAGSTEQEVRSAYRHMVKVCHPDQFQDPEKRKAAQDELVRLNLAYEEALRLCTHQAVGFNRISPEEAKHFARRLMKQGNMESALRQLARAEIKDADWYCLQGDILMSMRQYETAHQSFREAVRLRPDSNEYHERALNAALAMKKAGNIGVKIGNAFKDLFHKH